MASHARIYNLTRKFSFKRSQAIRAIESCACAWVEEGRTVRDLTIAEAIQARNVQVSLRERLAFAELPGLIFRLPAGREGETRAERAWLSKPISLQYGPRHEAFRVGTEAR